MKRIALLLSLLIPLAAHADPQVGAGSTSQCFDIFVSDSSSSTGGGLTGLAYNSGSLTCYYHRRGASSATSITLASSTLGTYTSGAFKEISSSNMPGAYEFCPPDAALATGASDVFFTCKGATNMAPMNLRVTLLSPNTYGFDGKLASESGTTIGLASGAVDADDQFNYQTELVVFDSAGLVSAVSCITDSTNSGDTVVTAEDISSLVAVNDNYLVRPNAGCRNLRPTTSGLTLDVHANGDAEANVTKINGSLTNGNNATLSLAALNITNSGGDAVVIASTGSNGDGIDVSGNGTGSGILSTGGATGRGVYAKGGATSGAGIRAEGMGGNSAGFNGIGIGSSPGMDLTGGSSGAGFLATGGGAGAGFQVQGGATGAGFRAAGGATSGHGFYVTATSGSEIDADLAGSVGSLSTTAKAEVNAEVLDVLNVDTFAELSACPTFPMTLKTAIIYLAELARQKIVQTSSSTVFYKDNGTDALCTHLITNSSGTFTRAEGS